MVTALYANAFWRILKENRGNRVIECGIISLVLAFASGFAIKLGAPDWLIESMGLLLLLMSFLTLGLFSRECYVALRRRLRKSN